MKNKFVNSVLVAAFCGAGMKVQAEPGEFLLWVGTSSADERNESTFTFM